MAKQCNGCKKHKTSAEFYKYPDGTLYATCKVCKQHRVMVQRIANGVSVDQEDDGPSLEDVRRDDAARAEQRKRDFEALRANTCAVLPSLAWMHAAE
jgi:hypothetical protein